MRRCYSSLTRDREYKVLGSTIFTLKAIIVTQFIYLANLIYTQEGHQKSETEIRGDALRIVSLDPYDVEGVISNKKTTDVATDRGRIQTKGGRARDIVVQNALNGLLLFYNVYINVYLFLYKEYIVRVIINVYLLSTKASQIIEGLVIVIIKCSYDSIILLFSKASLRYSRSSRC